MIASSGSMLLVSLLAAVMSCNGVYPLLVEGTQRSFQFASISGDFRVDRQTEGDCFTPNTHARTG